MDAAMQRRIEDPRPCRHCRCPGIDHTRNFCWGSDRPECQERHPYEPVD